MSTKITLTKELSPSIVEKVNKASKQISTYLHCLSNEPSVGLYHVQEHIRKTIPRNTELKREIKKKYQLVESTTYDLDFSIQTVKDLQDLTTFKDIKTLIDAANELLNQVQKTPISPVKPHPTPPSTPHLQSTKEHQQQQQTPPHTPKGPKTLTPREEIPPLNILGNNPTLPPVSSPPKATVNITTTQSTDQEENENHISSTSSGDGGDTDPTRLSRDSSTDSVTMTTEIPSTPEKSESEVSPVVTSRRTPKKSGAKKKPKVVKSLVKDFDLQPKQF